MYHLLLATGVVVRPDKQEPLSYLS